MSEKESPLRERPLHVPGQSMDETINRLWDDRGLSYLTYMIGFVSLALFEWFRWLKPSSVAPWLTTAVALLVAAYCLGGLLRLRRRTELLRLGRDGERAVAEVLEELRAKDCLVFHDIIGNGFNVDHVVLSTHGLFAIETKTIRKPPGRSHQATVKVEGGRIRAGGADLGSNPLDQARASAQWVHRLLKQSTGKSYSVKPCLVFPGWFVEPMSKELPRDIWVLNPKGLVSFIQNEALHLKDEDLRLAAFHLSMYCRSPWAADSGRFARKIMKSQRRLHAQRTSSR